VQVIRHRAAVLAIQIDALEQNTVVLRKGGQKAPEALAESRFLTR
jgi:hypothetical protein